MLFYTFICVHAYIFHMCVYVSMHAHTYTCLSILRGQSMTSYLSDLNTYPAQVSCVGAGIWNQVLMADEKQIM